jgi:hypothetical protein
MNESQLFDPPEQLQLLKPDMNFIWTLIFPYFWSALGSPLTRLYSHITIHPPTNQYQLCGQPTILTQKV